MIIEQIAFVPAFVEGKSAVEYLKAEVIFFVDHDAVSFAAGDDDSAGAVAAGEFAADELSFHEELGIKRRQGFHVDVMQRAFEKGAAECFGEAVYEFVADIGGGAGDKGEAGDVSREADAAGDDNVRLRAISSQPFAAAGGEGI